MDSKSKRLRGDRSLNKRRNVKKVSDENELVPPETQKSVRHALRSSTNLKRKTQR